MTITTSDLEALLVAKTEAKLAWDAAHQNAAKLTSTDPVGERVCRDLENVRLRKIYCACDDAYEAALGQYVLEERERRANA